MNRNGCSGKTLKLWPILVDHFKDKAKEYGLTPEKIEDLRKYAMGWVQDSNMASVYNEYQLAVTVADISSKTQSKAVPKLGGHHEQ